MSMKLAALCWELVLTQSQFKVLSALADSADEDGSRCYPGIPYLAWKTDYDERSVRRTLRSLEEAGYIEVVAHAGGRPGEFTQYILHMDRVPRKAPYQRPRGGNLSPVRQVRRGTSHPATGDISSPDGGHKLQRRGTSDPETGDISSRENGTLADGDTGTARGPVVKPVVNPVKDPYVNPSGAPAGAGVCARETDLPAFPKPSQVLAVEQAGCPVWEALIAAAGEPPAPGLEYERWTATWRNLLATGTERQALAEQVALRAARWGRVFTVPFSVPALVGNWTKLGKEPRDTAAPTVTFAPPLLDRTDQAAAAERAATARAALLDQLGTDSKAQVWWHEQADRLPRLRPCWRGAIFVPPKPGRAAALIFPERAEYEAARGSPMQTAEAKRRIQGHYRGLAGEILILALGEPGQAEGDDDDGDTAAADTDHRRGSRGGVPDPGRAAVL